MKNFSSLFVKIHTVSVNEGLTSIEYEEQRRERGSVSLCRCPLNLSDVNIFFIGIKSWKASQSYKPKANDFADKTRKSKA